MPDTHTDPGMDTLSFPIEPDLKADFAAIAEKESKPIGELLREVVRERVERERRREFEVEARRQSLELAAAARDPNSDEAQILRELDAHFDEFARDEWKWE